MNKKTIDTMIIGEILIFFLISKRINHAISGKLDANILTYVVHTIIAIIAGIPHSKNGFIIPPNMQTHKAKLSTNQGISAHLTIIVTLLGDSFPLKIEMIEKTVMSVAITNVAPMSPRDVKNNGVARSPSNWNKSWKNIANAAIYRGIWLRYMLAANNISKILFAFITNKSIYIF